MEYIYAALLLHKAGKPLNEENIKKVLNAAAIDVNESRVKALVAALDGVDIAKAIENAAPVAAVASAASVAPAAKKEEQKVSTEEAAAGLGSLFG